MKTIRNKRTGEVRVVADHEVGGFIPKAQEGFEVGIPDPKDDGTGVKVHAWGGYGHGVDRIMHMRQPSARKLERQFQRNEKRAAKEMQEYNTPFTGQRFKDDMDYWQYGQGKGGAELLHTFDPAEGYQPVPIARQGGMVPKAQNNYANPQQTASGTYRWPKSIVGYPGGPTSDVMNSSAIQTATGSSAGTAAGTGTGSGGGGMNAAGMSSFIGGAADTLAPFFEGGHTTQIQPGQTTVTQGPSTGGTVLKGAAKGAATGAVFGPWGAVIGGVVGAGAGALTAGRERKREREEERQINSVQRQKYQDLDYDPNLDPYGNERVFYAQEGGMPPEQGMEEAPQEEGQEMQQQQPPQDQRQIVDIEKGELLTDPMTLDILYKYENPNKYSRHAKNPQKEPVGNFTKVEPGHVVISRKYAKTYEKGDTLTRKSIIMEIMKNQRNNPQEMTPAPGGMEGVEEAEYAQAGKKVGKYPRLNPSQYKSAMGYSWNNQSPFTANDTPDYSWTGAEAPQLNQVGYDPNALDPGTQMPDHQAQIERDRVWPGSNFMKPDLFPPQQDYPQSKTPLLDHQSNNEPPPGKKKWRPTMTDAALGLNFAATAYGLANAGKYERETYDENFGYDRAKTAINNLETNPSIEAARTSMDQMVAARNKGLNNFNSPSTRAEAASSFSSMLQGKNELIQNATNAGMDAHNKKLGALAELNVKQGEGRLAARTKLRENLQMNRANKHKLIQSGLSELSQNVGAQVMDQNRLNAINSILEYAKVKNSGEQVDTKEYSKKIASIVSSDYYSEGDLEKILDAYVLGKTKDRKVAKATNQKTNNTRT